MIMKRILTALAASASLLFTSCGDSSEDLAEDMVAHLEDAAEALKEFNSGDENAEDTIKTLEKIGDKLAETVAAGKKLNEDLSDEEKKEEEKAMMEKFGKRMEKASGDIQGEVVKLTTSGQVGGADVSKAVEALFKKMQ